MWHARQHGAVLVWAVGMQVCPASQMTISKSGSACGSQPCRGRTDYRGHLHKVLQQHVVEHLLVPVLAAPSRIGQVVPVCRLHLYAWAMGSD